MPQFYNSMALLPLEDDFEKIVSILFVFVVVILSL
jgi:hypothetical protein